MTLAELRTELVTDPTGLGYAAAWGGSDQGLADLLNLPRAAITVWRGLLPAYQVIDLVAWTEWTALSAANKQLLQTLTGTDTVNTESANTRAAFSQMFAAGTATRTALLAFAQRTGSRAEQLWGTGRIVTESEVSGARGLA